MLHVENFPLIKDIRYVSGILYQIVLSETYCKIFFLLNIKCKKTNPALWHYCGLAIDLHLLTQAKQFYLILNLIFCFLKGKKTQTFLSEVFPAYHKEKLSVHIFLPVCAAVYWGSTAWVCSKQYIIVPDWNRREEMSQLFGS